MWIFDIFWYLFVKKTVKTVYDVWGKKFICAHFLEGQNFILKKFKKNEKKMNLEIIILENKDIWKMFVPEL